MITKHLFNSENVNNYTERDDMMASTSLLFNNNLIKYISRFLINLNKIYGSKSLLQILTTKYKSIINIIMGNKKDDVGNDLDIDLIKL
jgi:hypothetical protein